MHQNVAFMKSLLLIFLGGGTGSVLRYLLTISFTTFSTFSNESLQLLKSGLYPSFFTYIISSVVLGILGVMLGIWMSE